MSAPFPAPSPVPAQPGGREPLRRRYAFYAAGTAALNTFIAVVLTLLDPHARGFGVNFVYSQCIGLSIMSCIALPDAWLSQRRQVTGFTKGLLIVFGILAGTFIGDRIGVSLVGAHPARGGAHTQQYVIITAIITITASVISSLFFWGRERVARLQADAAAERIRAESALRQASESRLRQIQAQVEPHMLFNTLANLRALVRMDPPAAEAMLDRLIAFLRATLAASRAERVPLAQEFTIVDDYLALMAIRFGARLTYRLELPDALRDRRVLPMLLQPLVENAIRHGIEPAEDGGSITVTADAVDDRLVLSVLDTGCGLPPVGATPPAARRDGGGFGLAQLRERLATAHGDAARVDIQSPPPELPRGTRITITLPATSS